MADYRQDVIDYVRTAPREDLEQGYLKLIQQRDDAHSFLDLLEPCPPGLTDDGKDYTVRGRLDWWHEHKSFYRHVGTLRKTGWNHLEFRQDGSVTLPDNERHDVWIEERVEP